MNLSGQGRPDAALHHHRRAIETFEVTVGASHELTGRALVGLADALVGVGDTAAAVGPLERSVAILDSQQSPFLPDAQFALARVLWDRGRQRARSRQLAEAARATLTTRDDAHQDLHEVDTWLRSHERK